MPSNQILALDDVHLSYTDEVGRTVRALTHVSFAVAAGEFVSIIGPSGCGKSTLLRIIAGTLAPTGGRITRSYSNLGMVFQNYGIFPWLTVEQNVEFGLRMRGMGAAECRRIAHAKIHETGLQGHERAYPAELSGGQKQRIGIARAIAIQPDVLLMDEPFSNLDAGTAEILKLDLLKLWEKYRMSVIMVSHLAEDAAELSDRIFVMTPRPGTIKKIEHITLARPRATRGAGVHMLADTLRNESA